MIGGSHACVVSYGSTYDADIPLVLVVGREPNDTSTATADRGTYDFRKWPNCAFWNVAYGVLGAAASPALNTAAVKRLAVAKAASPIIIADAFPRSIANKVRDKTAQRAAISDSEIEQHVDNIFAHEHLIRRTKIVLLSGHENVFSRSSQIFQSKCRDLNIQFQSLPFFYGTNVPKIRNEITPPTRQTLREISDAFAAFDPA